jgi:hypothetical protein
MGRKSLSEELREPGLPQSAQPEGRIREDLERRGVSAEFSGSVSTRLETLASKLSSSEYALVLESVEAAYGAHRDDQDRSGRVDEIEIQHMVQDFAVELKKLDEGLRVLSAYLLRIRQRTSSRKGSADQLH